MKLYLRLQTLPQTENGLFYFLLSALVTSVYLQTVTHEFISLMILVHYNNPSITGGFSLQASIGLYILLPIQLASCMAIAFDRYFTV
jgi:hypothetical protein